jgi:hypothetical protein
MTTMKMAAMNAAKAMSSTAVLGRSFMSGIKGKMRPAVNDGSKKVMRGESPGLSGIEQDQLQG